MVQVPLRKKKYEIVPREKTFKKESDFLVTRKIMSFFPSLVVPNSVISI